MDVLARRAHQAIQSNDEAALRELLRSGGLDVNAMISKRGRDGHGQCTLLYEAATRGSVNLCEVLLAAGADVQIRETERGGIPLHAVASHGNVARARLLLAAAGANINTRTQPRGLTPLHVACQHGYTRMATFLIAAGATIAAKSQNATTPLRAALRRGHRTLVLTLLRAGAPLTVLRSKQINPENSALHDYMLEIIDSGGWDARVERHRRPLMSILSRLALPHDALSVVLSFWSPPGGH